MLNSIYIKNIALIPEARISLTGGLNILSGETGAGKSIIVDSLNFVLGAKSDKGMVRHGEKMALVEAVFDYNPLCEEIFNELLLEIEDKIIITRTITPEGKTSISLNGRTLNLSTLKRITSLLIDIHGQHEHQAVLKPSNHLTILDGCIKSDILAGFSVLYKEYKETLRELSAMGGSDAERERTLDILQYQIDEIKNAKLTEDEEEELKARRAKIHNTGKITAAIQGAMEHLAGMPSVSDSVYLSQNAIASITALDGVAEELFERLKSARLELNDIFDTLSDLLESYNFDEREADKVEDRLNQYKTLCRKYGGSVASVHKFLQNATIEFDKLCNSAVYLEKLRSKITALEEKLYSQCQEITNIRKKTSAHLEESLVKTLKNLGMNTKIEIVFNQYTRENFVSFLSSKGADTVEFFFSANKGEPLKPLAKIISGGEMSRFMLALKSIIAHTDSIPTMVFDEIDTGISGKSGVEVAKLLATIAQKHQVICITHLAQIASMADSHYLIEKYETKEKTFTNIQAITQDSSIAEIARLASGGSTALSLDHAREMKQFSQDFKQTLIK